jgi:hypothetical protein
LPEVALGTPQVDEQRYHLKCRSYDYHRVYIERLDQNGTILNPECNYVISSLKNPTVLYGSIDTFEF